MVSIGHRTGIFDALRDLASSTSEEIANKVGLNKRYVREWLGAMATAEVVVVDPTSTRYELPVEHAAFLTREAGSNNIAVFTQYIAILGAVEDEIVECFKRGGGVPYEKFLRFHAVMAEDSGQSVLSSLESHVLPLVPELTDQLAKGIRVLDIGCGNGRIMNRLIIDVNNPRLNALGKGQTFGEVAGEDTRKPIGSVVCHCHGFLFVCDLNDGDHPTERLLAREGSIQLYVAQHRRVVTESVRLGPESPASFLPTFTFLQVSRIAPESPLM
jgi:hypothetical protein